MKQILQIFISTLLALCSIQTVFANDVYMSNTAAYVSAQGPSFAIRSDGSPNPPDKNDYLHILTTGTKINILATLSRPGGSTDEVGVAIYLVPIYQNNDRPSAGQTAKGKAYTANSDDLTILSSDSNNSGSWLTGQYTGSGTAPQYLDLKNHPKLAFTLSSASPGAITTQVNDLYIATFDIASKVILQVSGPIPVLFDSPAPPQPTAAPVLNSIAPASGPSGTSITLSGSGFTSANEIDFSGSTGGVLRSNFTVVSDTQIKMTVPTDAATGPVTILNSSNVRSNSVNFTVTPPAYAPLLVRVYDPVGPQITTQGIYNDALIPGGIARFRIAKGAGSTSQYGITAVNLNGIVITLTSNSYVNMYDIEVRVPSNATPGPAYLITRSLGNSNSVPYYFPRPQNACSNYEICSDQCVQYNATPAPLLGRLIANKNGYTPTEGDAWVTYNYYLNTVHYFSEPVFTSNGGEEKEQVQWQLSYTNNGSDWQDIPNAIERDYQPGPATNTTYYRRSSTHELIRYYTQQPFRDHWYDSNTITVNVGPQSPTSASTLYKSCGSGNKAVSVYPVPTATSYNWTVPYPGWGISTDGTNPYSSYNNGGNSFNTATTQVFITIPSNVSAGDYYVYVSATGACNLRTTATKITIRVTPGGAPVGTIGSYTRITYGTGDAAVYNLSIPPVTNANSYTITFDDGQVRSGSPNNSTRIEFDTQLPCSYIGGFVITASGTCDDTKYRGQVKTPYCSGQNVVALPAASLSLYPNPTTEQVTIGAVEQDAVAFFYDSQGTLRKQVSLKAVDKQTVVSIKDLSPGIYHAIINSGSTILITEQLVVQH